MPLSLSWENDPLGVLKKFPDAYPTMTHLKDQAVHAAAFMFGCLNFTLSYNRAYRMGYA